MQGGVGSTRELLRGGHQLIEPIYKSSSKGTPKPQPPVSDKGKDDKALDEALAKERVKRLTRPH